MWGGREGGKEGRLRSPRSEGRVRANRVRTVQVAALSDVMCRLGSPGAFPFIRMTHTALARKYRPKQFRDLVAQEHVAAGLVGAVAKNRVAHAYLLARAAWGRRVPRGF